MKIASEVTPEKLRGGFYSPPGLIAVCLDRVDQLLGDRGSISVLEPSAGDGAFIRGLAEHRLRDRISEMTAVELLDTEAAACESAGGSAPFPVRVHCTSFLGEVIEARPGYDVAVGNPPFVRFQFISTHERRRAEELSAELGFLLKGVSNLWIPILIKALACLREGGAFAFIVPAECMTGISAAEFRRWLVRNTDDLALDLFPPGSFPEALQEVVVLSGIRRTSATPSVRVVDHSDRAPLERRHSNHLDEPTWTRLLLTPAQLEAMDEAASLPGCISLGHAAKFGVATVTGANDFFTVSEATARHYDLQPWTKPLLPRIRNAQGLVFATADFEACIDDGIRCYLLDFAANSPEPTDFPAPASYLAEGEADLLHERYKCRIRSPWYRVPVVAAADLLLSKRSHLYPRVVLNEVRALTTDTIYQGKLTPPYLHKGRALAASFHNSMTLLSAEVEGRSFGGGVLELVPSEVTRLRLFVPDQMADEVDGLDTLSRSSAPDKDDMLIEETGRLLTKHVDGLTDALLSVLDDARRTLQRRRLERNRSSVDQPADAAA